MMISMSPKGALRRALAGFLLLQQANASGADTLGYCSNLRGLRKTEAEASPVQLAEASTVQCSFSRGTEADHANHKAGCPGGDCKWIAGCPRHPNGNAGHGRMTSHFNVNLKVECTCTKLKPKHFNVTVDFGWFNHTDPRSTVVLAPSDQMQVSDLRAAIFAHLASRDSIIGDPSWALQVGGTTGKVMDTGTLLKFGITQGSTTTVHLTIPEHLSEEKSAEQVVQAEEWFVLKVVAKHIGEEHTFSVKVNEGMVVHHEGNSFPKAVFDVAQIRMPGVSPKVFSVLTPSTMQFVKSSDGSVLPVGPGSTLAKCGIFQNDPSTHTLELYCKTCRHKTTGLNGLGDPRGHGCTPQKNLTRTRFKAANRAGGDAKISYDLYPYYDTTNPPSAPEPVKAPPSSDTFSVSVAFTMDFVQGDMATTKVRADILKKVEAGIIEVLTGRSLNDTLAPGNRTSKDGAIRLTRKAARRRRRLEERLLGEGI